MTQDTSISPSPEVATEENSVQLALDTLLARHRKELRDLQSRITQKKKSATKRTRRGVNDECERLERDLKERHAQEIAAVKGEPLAEQHQGQEQEETDDGNDEQLAEGANGLKLESAQPPNGPEIPITTRTATSPSEVFTPRKPNRAKARLARRAAEMEAQVAAAALEASLQPDRRAAELAALRERFSALGLTEHEIRPDGHCLYSAFADQLDWLGIPLAAGLVDQDQDQDQDQDKPAVVVVATDGAGAGTRPYKLARLACAKYLAEHRASFEPFLDCDATATATAGEGMDAHIVKVRDTAEWGGQMEVLALAKAYGVVANVVQAEGAVLRMGEDADADAGAGAGAGAGRRGKQHDVWLAYYRHSYGLGEHYNSLRASK